MPRSAFVWSTYPSGMHHADVEATSTSVATNRLALRGVIALGTSILSIVWTFGWASLDDPSGAGLLTGWLQIIIYAVPVALTGLALVRTVTTPAPRRWLWASSLLGMGVYWVFMAVLVLIVASQVA
jgi:hypothetical protein